MAKSTTIWRSNDGREWKTKEAAERHDELVSAKWDYVTVRSRLFALLSGQLQTRDGQAVEFGKRGRYYAVMFEHQNPIVAEVALTWNHWDWELADGDELRVILRWQWPGDRDDKFQLIHIPVKDLWADRDKARVACLQARRRQLDREAELLAEQSQDLNLVKVWG